MIRVVITAMNRTTGKCDIDVGTFQDAGYRELLEHFIRIVRTEAPEESNLISTFTSVDPGNEQTVSMVGKVDFAKFEQFTFRFVACARTYDTIKYKSLVKPVIDVSRETN